MADTETDREFRLEAETDTGIRLSQRLSQTRLNTQKRICNGAYSLLISHEPKRLGGAKQKTRTSRIAPVGATVIATTFRPASTAVEFFKLSESEDAMKRSNNHCVFPAV